MASRLVRRTVILAKAEVTYGVDPVPTGAANALLVGNVSINPLNAQNVSRDVLIGHKGNFQHLVGTRFVECGFEIELVGGGTAGTAPAWGPVLMACGFSENSTATVRVDYVPISVSDSSITIYWYDDGTMHKITGARGNVSFRLNSGGRPIMAFNFKGIYNTPTSPGNTVPTLTGFKVPEVVTEANTADLTFGGTHTLAIAPAITGGTTYPSMGIEMNMNNEVEHVPLLGGESVEIPDRSPSCNFQLELTSAQEVTFMTDVAAATTTTIGLVHGTTAGYKTLLWLPYVQKINPSKQEIAGKRMHGFEGRVTPSVGNDECRLVLF